MHRATSLIIRMHYHKHTPPSGSFDKRRLQVKPWQSWPQNLECTACMALNLAPLCKWLQ